MVNLYSTIVQQLFDEVPSEKKKLLKHIGFVIIRPDAIAKGYEGDIINDFSKKGLYVIGFKYQFIDERQIEEVYRYSQHILLGLQVRPVWWMTRAMYKLSPAIIVLLAGEFIENFDDCAKYIKSIKGPANPAETTESHLRHKYRSMNVVLCTIHSSDNMEQALRESRIFFNREEFLTALEYVPECLEGYKPKPHVYLEKYIESWYGKTKRTDSFFEILVKLKVRVLANLIEWNQFGIDVNRLRSLYDEMFKLIENNNSYVRECESMYKLLNQELEILGNIDIAKLEESILLGGSYRDINSKDKISLIKVLHMLADYRNYDKIPFSNFKNCLDRNLVFLDEWETLVLDTSFVFHNMQLKSYYENNKLLS